MNSLEGPLFLNHITSLLNHFTTEHINMSFNGNICFIGQNGQQVCMPAGMFAPGQELHFAVPAPDPRLIAYDPRYGIPINVDCFGRPVRRLPSPTQQVTRVVVVRERSSPSSGYRTFMPAVLRDCAFQGTWYCVKNGGQPGPRYAGNDVICDHCHKKMTTGTKYQHLSKANDDGVDLCETCSAHWKTA